MCHHCPARAASQDGADLYWSFENNNWDSHHFSLDEFINYRMPQRSMCNLCMFQFLLIDDFGTQNGCSFDGFKGAMFIDLLEFTDK